MEKWSSLAILTLLVLAYGPMSALGRSEMAFDSSTSYDLPSNNTYITAPKPCPSPAPRAPTAILVPDSREPSPGSLNQTPSDVPPLAVPSVAPSSSDTTPDHRMPYGVEPVTATPPPTRAQPPSFLAPLASLKRNANTQKEEGKKVSVDVEKRVDVENAEKRDRTFSESASPPSSLATTMVQGATIAPSKYSAPGGSQSGGTCRTGFASFYSYNVPSLRLLNMVRSWTYNELFIEEEVGFRLIYDTALVKNESNWEGNNPQLSGSNTTLPQHIQIALPSHMLDQLYLDYETMLNATLDPQVDLANFTFQPSRSLPLAITTEYLGAATANLTDELGQVIPPRNVTKGDGSATIQLLVSLQWQSTPSGSFSLTALFGISSSQFSSSPDSPLLLTNAPLRSQSHTLAIAVGASVGGVVVAVAAIIIAIKASSAASSSHSIRLTSV